VVLSAFLIAANLSVSSAFSDPIAIRVGGFAVAVEPVVLGVLGMPSPETSTAEGRTGEEM
jgi:hypothetical protein